MCEKNGIKVKAVSSCPPWIEPVDTKVPTNLLTLFLKYSNKYE